VAAYNSDRTKLQESLALILGGWSATPSKIMVAFNLIASASRFRLWAGSETLTQSGYCVGTYLVPALVERGHEIVNVTRGTASPYKKHPAWKAIEQVVVERKVEEAEGKFGSRIAGLNADIVIDMISFDLGGTHQLVDALRGEIEHYLFCSSIWVYGHMQPRSRLQKPTLQTPSIHTGSTRQRSRLGFCSGQSQIVSGRVDTAPQAPSMRLVPGGKGR